MLPDTTARLRDVTPRMLPHENASTRPQPPTQAQQRATPTRNTLYGPLTASQAQNVYWEGWASKRPREASTANLPHPLRPHPPRSRLPRQQPTQETHPPHPRAHAPHLQLAPQHTQHRTHINNLTAPHTITRLHISKTLTKRHRRTIRSAHHVSRIHDQQQVTHRGHVRVTVRAYSVSERRARIAQNRTARLSMIELRRRKHIPRIMTPTRHIRHTRRVLTITKHVTRQPVTLVRDRARSAEFSMTRACASAMACTLTCGATSTSPASKRNPASPARANRRLAGLHHIHASQHTTSTHVDTTGVSVIY